MVSSANDLARRLVTDQNPCSKRSCFSLSALRAIVEVCKILPWRSPSGFVAAVWGGPSSKIVGFEQHRNRLLVGRREEEEYRRR